MEFMFTTEVEIVKWDGKTSWSGKSDLKWSMSVDARATGVKSLDIIVPDQQITTVLTDCSNSSEKEETLELKSVRVETPNKFGSIMPDIVQIDVVKGRAIVEF